MKETAKKLKTTPVKVRKVLITEGLWSSKTSLEVQEFLQQGFSTREIAEKLSTTEKAVQQYLPYTKGLYGSDNPSVAALNSADYRERIRIAREKTLKKKKTVGKQWEERKQMGKVESWRCLHLELEIDDIDMEETVEVLKKYGDVKYGNTVSRDVIVPNDIPLWALNYAIQKCFGWQNSHLHCFELPNEQFRKICSDKFFDLVGVVFRSPWMGEEEQFWADDYEDGSFKNWLRKKYTGPYESLCYGEGLLQCKQDVKEIKKRFAYVSIEHDEKIAYDGTMVYSWPKVITKKEYEELKAKGPVKRKEKGYRGMEVKIREAFTFEDIPFDALRWMFESNINCLLERLCVQEVFDGLSDELLYKYDFGDGWCVKVTSEDAKVLITNSRVTEEEVEEAVEKLQDAYRPVCIAQDGRMVLDDVGGICGYAQFLKGINQKDGVNSLPDDEDEEKEYGLYADKEESLEWAKSLGWSKRKVSCKNML